MFLRRVVLALFALTIGSVLCHAATIDAGLFTTYTTNDAKTTLDWTVCGSIGTGSGCYDSGGLGPFNKIGSVIEGNKSYDLTTGTVTRFFYVIDQAYGSSLDGVALYAYKRTDTITGGSETTTFTFKKTVVLPLTGGDSALVFMAANDPYLVIGTSLSTVPVEVKKSSYAITPLPAISQVPTSITADNYGFVTVTSADGFFVLNPSGSLEEDGGGAPFTINTILGIQP